MGPATVQTMAGKEASTERLDSAESTEFEEVEVEEEVTDEDDDDDNDLEDVDYEEVLAAAEQMTTVRN